MICGIFIYILLSSCCDTQNCVKMYLLRIPFHWVCSWLQLVFWPKTICSILQYCIMSIKNKLLIIKEPTTVIKLYLTKEEYSSILANL